jgi:polyribonucleotide nucleotidyltransferase
VSDYEDEMDCHAPELLDVQVTGKVDVAHITRGVVEEIKKEMSRRIAREASSAVEEALLEGVKDHAKRAAEEVLSKGWQVADDYGRNSRTVTVKDRVMEMLAEKPRYDSKTPLQRAFDDALSGEVNKMVREEIEKARVAFRAQVDSILQTKLAETLRNSLGLK